MNPVTIIGTGMAGYTLAKEIRKLDDHIPVRMITADDGRVYSKPMLSNALTKQLDIEKLTQMRATDMADKFKLDIITQTRVDDILSECQQISTSRGTLEYSSLVLACGASPIRLPIGGDGADDILSVNSLTDYEQFLAQLDNKQRIAILGAGLIGCEFANDLVNTQHQVALIDVASKPLGRLLPDLAGDNLQQKLAGAGINWHLNASLEAIEKTATGYSLQLSNAETLEVDLVLSAIGLSPNTQLAQSAGLEINRGIVANSLLQTSNENIYTLGDCAEINGQVLPFIMPIMHAARALAKTLTGNMIELHYPPMPVVVKTPTHPVVICPPAPGSEGEWIEEATSNGVRARFMNNDRLEGFALTGDAVADKNALLKEMTA